MISEAKLSLICFLLSTPLGLLILFPHFWLGDIFINVYNIIWHLLITYAVFINVIFYIVLADYAYQIAVRACFLGFVFTSGLLIIELTPTSCTPFGWYMCVMAFFHFSEFFTIAVTNPKTLTISSFILNHSNEYWIAAVASWIEFSVELYFVPELKELRAVSYAGLCLCLGGEVMRKLAMITAATNFNHVVQTLKHQDHQLVTHGVYGLCRHPSYVGWFYWSMGTQMILLNPVCFVGYILASWNFFNERTTVEEITLLNFFGERYITYQEQVPTGLPFIKGYRVEE